MADVPERLFRDDAGAAIERAARLEQENQQLRAELRRFQRPDEVPTLRTRRPVQPSWAAAVAAVGAGLFLLTAAVGFVSHAGHPHSVAHFPPPQVHPLPPSLLGASPAPPVVISDPAAAEEQDCETPYSYDEHGVKHYKMQCIHPERAQR